MDRRIVEIKESDFVTKREALMYLAGELDFPAYFGGNLDALNDCLGEITVPTHIILKLNNPDSGESSYWMKDLNEVIRGVSEWNQNVTWEKK